MVFPVVMYGCESWTIKKAEHWRIDAFELWCWRRLLRVPWTARRSNQSILKEISPGYSLEGLMLKLKLQYLGPPDAKSWLIWKDPDAGEDWGQEEKGTTEDEMVGWHHWLNGHGLGYTPGVSDGQGGLVCCSSWDRKESDMPERLNWLAKAILQSFIYFWTCSGLQFFSTTNIFMRIAFSCVLSGITESEQEYLNPIWYTSLNIFQKVCTNLCFFQQWWLRI